MEIAQEPPASGTQTLRPARVAELVAAAPFEAMEWAACRAVLLRSHGLLIQYDSWCRHPAIQFHELLSRPVKPRADGRTPRIGYEDALCRLLALGWTPLHQTHAADLENDTSWALYLTEDLSAIVAFCGHLLPRSRSSYPALEDLLARDPVRSIDAGVEGGRLVRSERMTVDVERPTGGVVHFRFTGAHAGATHRGNGDDRLARIVEVLEAPDGPRWFVFVPEDQAGTTIAMQADEIHWADTGRDQPG